MMRMVRELAAELIGMFFAETRLTFSILMLVAATGWLVDFTRLDRRVCGAILLFGCLALLVASVCNAARPRAR